MPGIAFKSLNRSAPFMRTLAPIFPCDDEHVEKYRLRIEMALNALEEAHDPLEAHRVRAARGTDGR